MKKVESSRKINLLSLKKLLASAGLMLTMGMVVAPSAKVYASEEVLFEDKSSDDVNLTDAETPAVQDTKSADQVTNPGSTEANSVVEQTNGKTAVTKKKETVNDGSVDTSAGTKTKDAKKDKYNGDDNDYFDSYDKSKDKDPKGGEYIDSDDEITRKHITPPPVPKTGENPWLPAAGILGASVALCGLYDAKRRLSYIKSLAEDTVEETETKKLSK